MTNVVVLIGIIDNSYYDKKSEQCYVNLKLEKMFGNPETKEYEYYLVKLWKGVYNNISSISSLKENVILGVKGRLEQDHEKIYIVAEKISILGKSINENK